MNNPPPPVSRAVAVFPLPTPDPTPENAATGTPQGVGGVLINPGSPDSRPTRR